MPGEVLKNFKALFPAEFELLAKKPTGGGAFGPPRHQVAG